VPLVTATGAILSAIRNTVVNAYPGAAAGSLIGAVLVAAAAVWWHGRLASSSGDTTGTEDKGGAREASIKVPHGFENRE
jgi:hypothetical protein